MKVLKFLSLEMRNQASLSADQAALRDALEAEDERIGERLARLEVPGILALGLLLYFVCSLFYFGLIV
ncbi:MAG: hypothetical protein LC135_11470 [Phycisphaerae bacterium]|jgi:hypothetical protein|nr:hypothetical protein [Phycisphaerae bacterium]MCZ2400467.1 hypothetical protein [Phycisphaerae bacterium]